MRPLESEGWGWRPGLAEGGWLAGRLGERPSWTLEVLSLFRPCSCSWKPEFVLSCSFHAWSQTRRPPLAHSLSSKGHPSSHTVAKAPGPGWMAWGSVPHGTPNRSPGPKTGSGSSAGWGEGVTSPSPPACLPLSPDGLPCRQSEAGSGWFSTPHRCPGPGTSQRLRERFLMKKHSGARVPLLPPCSMSSGSPPRAPTPGRVQMVALLFTLVPYRWSARGQAPNRSELCFSCLLSVPPRSRGAHLTEGSPRR